nr:immunoglobulin heavy chain junction region [Mus musculus]
LCSDYYGISPLL